MAATRGRGHSEDFEARVVAETAEGESPFDDLAQDLGKLEAFLLQEVQSGWMAEVVCRA